MKPIELAWPPAGISQFKATLTHAHIHTHRERERGRNLAHAQTKYSSPCICPVCNRDVGYNFHFCKMKAKPIQSKELCYYRAMIFSPYVRHNLSLSKTHTHSHTNSFSLSETSSHSLAYIYTHTHTHTHTFVLCDESFSPFSYRLSPENDVL